VQFAELLAQLPPGIEQNFHEFAEFRHSLYKFTDALFEHNSACDANLETKIAQEAANVVFYCDSLFLK